MGNQNDALSKTIKKLAKTLAEQTKHSEKDPVKKSGILGSQDDVKLPNDIRKWRNAHVQAWVAFQMELPQYIDSFQEASIDGLMLLNYVDEKVQASYYFYFFKLSLLNYYLGD